MEGLLTWSEAHVAGALLLLGVVALAPGVAMFWMRGGMQGKAAPSQAYMVCERSFIMAAVVFTLVGFVLLEGAFESIGGRVLTRMGATAHLFAGVLVVAGEALALTQGFDKIYGLSVA